MSPETSEIFPLVLVTPFLVVMAHGDLKRLKISNRLVLGMLVAFVACAPLLLPLPEIGFRAMAAAVVFLLGLAGFAFGLWGGGDVKALSAVILFLPSDALTVFAFVFSASMFAGIAAVLTLRALAGKPDSPWRSLRPQAGFPIGLSIALSGISLPPVIALNLV